MPRRTRPLQKTAGFVVDATDGAELRTQVDSIIGRQSWRRQLTGAKRGALVAALVDAIGFARVGLENLLAGKRTRPAAWTMDIFMRDVCDALNAAGIAYTMTPTHQGSRAQLLAKQLAVAAGLPDQGELFHQMQAARKIEKAGGATCPGKPILVLGQWRVLGKKADLP
jgi:hypothetical protein